MGSFSRPEKPPLAKQAVDQLAGATKGPTLADIKEQVGAELDKAVSSQLPETVVTATGTMSYTSFKETFSDVYDQIKDKTHLLTGRVTHTFSLSGLPITLRSLRNRERTALIPYLNPGTNAVEGAVNEAKYRAYVLAAACVKIGDITFPDVKLTPENVSEWMKHAHIMQAIDLLMDMDESVFTTIFSLFIDLGTAKHYALVENLKNH